MKTHNEVANAFVLAADAAWADRKEYYANDKGMLSMFKSDHKDTLSCAAHIRKGNIKALHKKIWLMDTAPREEVGYAVHAIDAAYFREHFMPFGWKDLD